jgi:hypothetical protein
MSLSTKLTCLHHGNERRLNLKSIISNFDLWSSTDVSVVRVENSQRVLLAIASNSGAKFLLAWLTSEFSTETFLSLALVFFKIASGLSV